MEQIITETERKVIEILVSHEPAPSAWGNPIHAIDRAMGWATADTTKFVQDLEARELVHHEAIVRDGRTLDQKWCWKEGALTTQRTLI